MSSPNRFLNIGNFTSQYVDKNNNTSRAAEELIDHPEKHLATQKELFELEGGYLGVFVQELSAVGLTATVLL